MLRLHKNVWAIIECTSNLFAILAAQLIYKTKTNTVVMKKICLAAMMASAILSCSSPTAEKTVETTADSSTVAAPGETPVSYPFPATYSADWKIGNPKDVVTVLSVYKAIEENRIDELSNYLADSVRSINYNAVERNLSKDDAIKMVKEFRSGFVSVNEEFIAYMPLHSVDKNEDWVATWMKEVTTDKKGKKDSTTYMERWQLRDGKIVYRGAFARDRRF